MKSWYFFEPISVLAIGKRLGLLLVGVAAYYILAALLIEWRDLQMPDWASAASLINTVILSMLPRFRNRVAYERWWSSSCFVFSCWVSNLIDSVVEEPFGRERDGLDLDRYCRTIHDAVYASLPARRKSGTG